VEFRISGAWLVLREVSAVLQDAARAARDAGRPWHVLLESTRDVLDMPPDTPGGAGRCRPGGELMLYLEPGAVYADTAGLPEALKAAARGLARGLALLRAAEAKAARKAAREVAEAAREDARQRIEAEAAAEAAEERERVVGMLDTARKARRYASRRAGGRP